MQVNKKQKIALIVIIVLVVVLAAVYFITSKKKQQIVIQEQQDQQEQQKKRALDNAPIVVRGQNLDIVNSVPPTKTVVEQQGLEGQSRMFVERFGTFTSDSDLSTIEDLYRYMSLSMKKWVKETYLPELKEKFELGEFYRIRTIAPAINIESENATDAIVIASCQRTEVNNERQEEKYLQDIRLEYKKINDFWYVEAAYWQDKR